MPPVDDTKSAAPLAIAKDLFLTPESMITPGLAGATIAFICRAVESNFHFGRYISHFELLLSFALGLLIVVNSRPLLLKIVYYFVNSLIIFGVSAGAMQTASGNQAARLEIFSPAYAQSSGNSSDDSPTSQGGWVNPLIGPQSIFNCFFGRCGFTVEKDTDRLGDDLRRASANTLEDCQKTCESDKECRAYTYFPVGAQPPYWKGDPPPICFLKSGLGKPVAYSGMISGVKTR